MAGRRYWIRLLAAIATVVTLSGGMAVVLPAGALEPGVAFDATATVTPHVVLRGQAGVDVAVVVTNHEGESIGSVLIRRPNGEFPEPATCGAAPAGWIGSPELSGSFVVDGCRFESAPGTADNIAAGTSATFHLSFNIQVGNRDALPDSWQVRAHTGDTFDSLDSLSVTAANPGDLDTEVRTFEVSRVVVANGATANPGDPCPAANQTAPVGATRTILVCGFNRGSQSRTPSTAVSSLTGTMLASTGTFGSASIPTGATNRVLTKYTGATIAGSAGSGKTIVARVGTNVTSPAGVASSVATTLSGFSAYGPVTHLELTTPSTTTAGVPLTATVTAKDAVDVTNADYVGTLHFATSDPQGELPSDYAFTAGDAGSHTFTNGVTLKTAGVRSIDVDDGTFAASANVAVSPAPPSQLRVETAADGSGALVPAQNVTAGDSVTLYAVSRDPYGNFVANAAADGWALQGETGGVADGDLVVTQPSNASAVFSGNLVGTATVRATRGGLTDGDSGVLTVVPGAPSSLVLGGFDDPTTAGELHGITVTALDDHGNVAVDYVGTMHFSSSDPAAVLPADYTFAPGDAGTHGFSATLKTAGERSITVTDTVDASRTATQADITVVHGPATIITLTGPTTDLDVGASRTFTATVYDAYGNVVTTGPDAAASIAFAKIAGTGSVSGTGSVTAAAGVASITVTGVASGPVTLQASAVFAGDASASSANTLTFSVSSQYQFSGFLGISGPPSVTTVKAGMVIPLVFSLDGNQGLDIFASGYPRSVPVPCTFPTTTSTGQATDALGRRDLHYIGLLDAYFYLWTTDRDWKNTCRQLIVKFADGQNFRVNLKFK